MGSFIQLLFAFSVVVQLIDSEQILDDVICQLVMNASCAHNLAPLIGKCCHHHGNAENAVQKRAQVKYDHERAEMSILSDWVGAYSWFANKQFE